MPWDPIIGLVGKPSSGKSSTLNSLTDSTSKVGKVLSVQISQEPNRAVGYLQISCACARHDLSEKCKPNQGSCIRGKRFVPLELLDVAGLVPGAHEGKGLGNKFLDDLRHADALIHVVDASGTTDAEGKSTRGYDPSQDIIWLKSEIQQWIKGNLVEKWGSIKRRHVAVKATAVETLQGQFSGYGSKASVVAKCLDRLALKEPLEAWTDDTVTKVVDSFIHEKFPTVVAVNKIDHTDADKVGHFSLKKTVGTKTDPTKNISKIVKMLDPNSVVLTSAMSEIFLRKLAKQNFIRYEEGAEYADTREDLIELGETDGGGLKELDPKTKEQLEKVKDLVLYRHGSTGVVQVLSRAASILGLCPVFPVRNISSFTNGTSGSVFPDCLLVKKNTTVADVARKVLGDAPLAYVEGVGGTRVSEDAIIESGKNDSLSSVHSTMQPSPSLETLTAWTKANGISLNYVKVIDVQGISETLSKGFGVVADNDIGLDDTEALPLIVVPQRLILSAKFVLEHSSTNLHLRKLLKSTPKLTETGRGTILLYLLHLTLIAKYEDQEEGKETSSFSGSWSQYLRFLRPTKTPSTWTALEVAMLNGTSLEAAVQAKINTLLAEVEYILSVVTDFKWFPVFAAPRATAFLDLYQIWVGLDAWYRSRAFQLPGYDDSVMVPILDMVNHEEGEGSLAQYDLAENGDVLLRLKPDKKLKRGEEIYISYGDHKGAAEMLFSYGFIDTSATCTNELTLELKVPDDDPLKSAKEHVAESTTAKITFTETGVRWESEFLWLICTNQEDGLGFRVFGDETPTLKIYWNDEEMAGLPQFGQLIRANDRFPIYKLRAICLLQEQVRMQKNKTTHGYTGSEKIENPVILKQCLALRKFESDLLDMTDSHLERQKLELLQSSIVQDYLQSMEAPDLT
ncbi:MAG: hypothetical protein M1814_005577 [Vezdaea aestivalis]|nr:MAG: hypothetical protein M1814_005577 [Vezdaea aestivalis]